MWVFLSDSLLSIVAHRARPSHLLVRARVRGDIESVFPGVLVRETPGADYRFRAVVRRSLVAEKLAAFALAIDYDNFKNSVSDPERHRAYSRAWSAGVELQETSLLAESCDPFAPPRTPLQRAFLAFGCAPGCAGCESGDPVVQGCRPDDMPV